MIRCSTYDLEKLSTSFSGFALKVFIHPISCIPIVVSSHFINLCFRIRDLNFQIKIYEFIGPWAKSIEIRLKFEAALRKIAFQVVPIFYLELDR